MPTWYLPCLLLISVLNSWSCLHYLLIVENKGSTAEGFRPKVESSEGENGTTSRTLITHRISHIIPSGPSLVWLLLSVLISSSILFWCWGNLHICGNACGKCNFLYHVNPLLLQKIHKHFHKRDFFLLGNIKSTLWHFYVVMKEQQSYRRKITIPDRADRLNRWVWNMGSWIR